MERIFQKIQDLIPSLCADVAKVMGLHRTFPGKCLVACTEPLPNEMRRKLLAASVPDNPLPPAMEPKRSQGRALPKTGFDYYAL
jgi:hypothetical protein